MKNSILVCLLLAGVSLACAANKKPINVNRDIKTEDRVVFKYGVAFLHKKAIYLDPQKLYAPEMFLSSKDKSVNPKGVLKPQKLFWGGNGELIVKEMDEKNTFGPTNDKQRFYYSVNNSKLLLKAFDSDWEPVTFVHVSDIDKYDEGGHEDSHTCMLLKIKTKWFQGVYEVPCE